LAHHIEANAIKDGKSLGSTGNQGYVPEFSVFSVDDGIHAPLERG
jgi:hypothetical protein